MSTLHATCASHTHAQTSCSKRVLCPPPRQLARVHHHTTLATESHRPKKKRGRRTYPLPEGVRLLLSSPSPHAPRLPIHSCPPSLSHRSACTPLAPRKAQTQPSPQPAQHNDSTVHTTQTRPIVTPPDTHNTPSMMGMQAYAPPSLHRVHPTPLPPQLCLSFRALMDYQSPESP